MIDLSLLSCVSFFKSVLLGWGNRKLTVNTSCLMQKWYYVQYQPSSKSTWRYVGVSLQDGAQEASLNSEFRLWREHEYVDTPTHAHAHHHRLPVTSVFLFSHQTLWLLCESIEWFLDFNGIMWTATRLNFVLSILHIFGFSLNEKKQTKMTVI